MGTMVPDDAVVIESLRGPDFGDHDKAMARSAWAHRQRAVAKRLLKELGYDQHPMLDCGTTLGGGAFITRRNGKHVRTGCATCKRNRLCGPCGQREAAVRGLIISAVTWLWMQEQGHDAAFLTIAIPHRRSDTLAEVHDALLVVWHEIKSKIVKRYAPHVAWAMEHSVGGNGPHPQIHAVLLLEREADEELCCRIQAEIDLYLIRRLPELGRKLYVGREAVDVRQCDQPEAMGAYLSKFGVGAEVAGSWDKQGRAKTSMPYQAIPAAVGPALHRRRFERLDRESMRLVRQWEEYLILCESDRRHWGQTFRKSKELLPGLADCKNDQEIIDLCLSVLPREVAEHFVIDSREEPARDDKAEHLVDDADWAGEDPGPEEPAHVEIRPDAWRALLFAWFRRADQPKGRLNDEVWRLRRGRWLWRTGDIMPEIELVVCWLLDELGTVAGCRELAEIVGAEVEVDELGVRVGMPHEL